MKVFIGLHEIAGYNSRLKQGFSELGLKADFITLAPHRFAYGGQDKPNRFLRALIWMRENRNKKWKFKGFRVRLGGRTWHFRGFLVPVKPLFYLFYLVSPPIFLLAVIRYDAFIFGFGTGFYFFKLVPFPDLPLLKLLGKRIIFVFFGTDARPSYLNGAELLRDGDASPTVEQCVERTRNKKRKIRMIEKYADVIISHPPYSYLFLRPFVQFLVMGIPAVHTGGTSVTNASAAGKDIRIVHAPSRPESKGTPKIREAIENLKRKGHKFEYVEIVNQPHAVVKDELQRCDFVVDQCYSDTPMAVFATEAASFGKPAVVGGYARAVLEDVVPPERLPPSLYCHPDEIEQAIERLVVDDAFRLELGEKAREFVETNWAPRKVAERFLRLIKGEVPEDWLIDPKEFLYVHSAGMPDERGRESVRAVLEWGGREALCVSDKPELERMLVEFAYSGSSSGTGASQVVG